ncbi:MAG: transporter large permease [Clostridia bacterium]|jgi:C4-dicarboxylate transporter DctM subunit|nr:transporter large permease [Clostridia bacterium]
MIGFLLFGTMAILLILGVPIAVCLGAATLLTVAALDVPMVVVSQRMFTALDSFSIMAIPFFVLAGNLMTEGGISKKLVSFCNSIVGNIRGGMAIVGIIACAFFAALSGSGPATVIAIGSMVYPEMVKLGYPKGRAAGLLAVSGGLGPIIPPSIVMVVYGTITNTSISDLFKSGMVCGILIAIAIIIAAIFLAYKEKWPVAEGKISIKAICQSFFVALPALMLPVIILGGIYSGIFTPTEAAAISVVYALAVGLYVYREIKISDLWRILVSSAKSSAMILFIIATSTAFAWLFSYSGISTALVEFIIGLNLSKMLFVLVVSGVLLVFGFFLEGLATVVLLVPVLFPIAQTFGINPIHFGMIVVIANVLGTMTPPVAVNIFASATVSKLPMGEIVKGQLPFFITMILVFFLIVLIPGISLMMI